MRISEERMSEIAYWIWFGRYPTDDGPEIKVINFFRNFPEGAEHGMKLWMPSGSPWGSSAW
jgi:hypothetical protein